MQRYIDLIKQQHASDKNAGEVIRLLQCLEHIEADIDRFSEHAHALGEYSDITTAKTTLLTLIQQTKTCFEDLITLNHPPLTSMVLCRFKPLTINGIEKSIRPVLDFFNIIREDYYIKSVRADEHCFVREFVASITQGPYKEDKSPLRPKARKDYTVKGTGVIHRSSRTPQYTPDQKRYYSKHQSVSLVHAKHQPPLFDHGKTRQKVSVAFMLHQGLVNRYFVYDGGTVDRPYDFFNPVKAQKYYDRKVRGINKPGKPPLDPILFADKDTFKQALLLHQHQGKYNEVLARLKWDKAHDKIAIGNDNFASRCMTQDYARILRVELKEQAHAAGDTWDDTYQIPICYYLPGQEKHLQPYTPEEQAKDQADALAIFRDAKAREANYQNEAFEFLLCLNDQRDIHATLLDNPRTGKPVLLRILESGNVHILLSLLEKADPFVLEQIHFNKEHHAMFSAEVIYRIARTNHPYLWRWLKESGVDVNTKNKDGNTALHLAAQKNTITAIKLITLKANVDALDKDERTPLYHAARYGHCAILQALLSAGADKDKAKNDGATPLFIAAQNGHVAVVEKLLAAGVDKDKAANDGATPLNIAAYKSHAAVVEKLLAAGVDKDKAMNDGATPLFVAAEKGHVAVIEKLLAAGADKDKATNDGAAPLFVAAKNGHAPVIEKLLAAGADKDKAADGATPLYIAAQNGYVVVVEKLLVADADKDKAMNDGTTPLFIAAQEGHLAIVEKLLAAGADIDKAKNSGATPLYAAAYDGHVAVVEELLAAGANKDKATNKNATPLYAAAYNGHVPVVEKLLAAGIDKDKATNNGATPLFIAAQEGHIAVVEKLLAAGADKDKAKNDGATPLFIAAQEGHVAVVEKLLAAGADKDKATNDGATPLFIAAQKGHAAVVEKLLAAGADKNKKYFSKTTPLEQAKIQGHSAVIDAFSKHALRQFIKEGPSGYEVRNSLSLFGLFASPEAIAEKTARAIAAAQALDDALNGTDNHTLQAYQNEIKQFHALNVAAKLLKR